MITRFWGRAIGPVPLLSICLLVIAGCSGDNKMEDPAGPGGSKTIYTWMDVQSEAGGTQLVLTYGGSLVSDAACGSEFSSEGWFQGGETTICMERANDVTFLVTEVGADYIRGNLNLNGKVWFKRRVLETRQECVRKERHHPGRCQRNPTHQLAGLLRT